MWNKIESQEVKELKAKVKDLNDQLADALVKNMNMNIDKLKTNVIVYLKNDKVLMIYDADDYSIGCDDRYAVIYKGEKAIASVKIEELTAISINTISVDDPFITTRIMTMSRGCKGGIE